MKLNTAVKNVMTKNLVTVFPETSFAEIKNIFQKNTFNHIPVINRNEEVVGIISKMDWLKSLKFVAEQSSGLTWTKKYYEKLLAKELMTENPVTIHQDDPISLVADILIENKYHALLVVENEKLIGILTSQDLIAFAYYDTPVQNII